MHRCAAYLDREFLGVQRELHAANLFEAAKAVGASDGSISAVGSGSLPEFVTGLHRIASDIGDGAFGSW